MPTHVHGDEMTPLRVDQIEHLLEILTGEVAPPALSRSLLDRTGGDPTRVLTDLLELLDEREPRDPDRAARNGALDLRPRGEFWSVSWGGRTVHLRDGRGVRYLAELAAHPGARLASEDLVAAAQPVPMPLPSREHARLAVTKAMSRVWRRLHALHPALAQHLEAALHCGYYCSYSPERAASTHPPVPDPARIGRAR